MAPVSGLSFEKCTLQMAGDQARLVFRLPGGIDFPLHAKSSAIRNLVKALNEGLGITPASPEAGSLH